MRNFRRRKIELASLIPLLLGTGFLLLAVTGTSAPFFNLGFEVGARGLPYGWFVNGPGFEFTLDSKIYQSGKQSLRIQNSNAPAGTLGVANQQFPIELVRGKHVHASGWIKTAGVRDGIAAMWWRVDGANGTLSLDNSPAPGPAPGTRDWTRYEFDRDVNPAAIAVWWGVFLRGSGTAWFDNIEISIDGVPVEQPPPPALGEPEEDQLAWIRSNPIRTNGATPGQGWPDLSPLEGLVGNARIVALGEATHGTREFFQMKHRILEFLANEMGFTIFSVEANMPEAHRVNDYVLTG
jgi:erythromycin esterase